MLRFTKRADYGLMAIHYIASHGEEAAVSAKRIAEEFHIPAELLAKILQRLAKKRLIVSHNGPKGGYVLARPAARDHRGAGACGRSRGRSRSRAAWWTTIARSTRAATCGCPVQKIQASISPMLDTHDAGRAWRRRDGSGGGAEPRPDRRERETETDDVEAADLHGQPVHHARGSAGAGGHAAVLHREVRPSGEPQPPLRVGGRGRQWTGRAARSPG